MRYENVFLMVRVTVHADHDNVFDIMQELQSQSTMSMTDTANINVLETKILVAGTESREAGDNQSDFRS